MDSNDKENVTSNKSGSKRWWVLLFACLLLVVVVLVLLESEDSIDVEQISGSPAAALVSVEKVTVSAETVEIKAFAEVRPRWSAELRSVVSGRVEKVFESALAGEQVEKGALLMTVEDTAYIAELESARFALKDAELNLKRAENQTAVARGLFNKSDTKPPSDMSLHLPELQVAKQSVASAKARIAVAQQQLEDTRIKAPFSGYISERLVSPGQTVSSGEPLLRLVDDQAFELTVQLGRGDWLLLQQPLAGHRASILNQEGELIGTARIRRGGGFLDENTRQYQLFLELQYSEENQLISGDFVQVVLPGITMERAANIAESALTQEGYIWSVDTDNRLKRHVPTVLFRKQGRVVIKAPDDRNEWLIAVTPLVSFLPGKAARPQLVPGHSPQQNKE